MCFGISNIILEGLFVFVCLCTFCLVWLAGKPSPFYYVWLMGHVHVFLVSIFFMSCVQLFVLVMCVWFMLDFILFYFILFIYLFLGKSLHFYVFGQ